MKSTKPISYLQKAISVLKSFTPEKLELGPSDISRKVGIPKSTVFHILSNLAEGGLLNRSGKKGKYTIGPELYIL